MGNEDGTIIRKVVVSLSVGPVEIEFYQLLGTTRCYWIEFTIDGVLEQLTKADWFLLDAIGCQLAKEVRGQWA